uniref:Pnap3592-like protein n=1 Tax=Hydrogenophaga sp. PL2G6 TaxID=503997 RepID=B4Y355_9BURK|nr:Pnap3592-like protein [Hydrogenophaga sp. PL2G6]
MTLRTVFSCGLALLAGLVTTGAQAQGFSAFVTPPRFELQVQPGERLRQVLEIQHAGLRTGRFRVYTNDWRFRPDQTVEFSDALSPDSCRPWVAVERRELSIEPAARFRYRFEIAVPPGTPPRECRFALMVEGADAAQVEGALNFPVGGRIAVIVYAAIGGAAPRLSMEPAGVRTVNGQQVPQLVVRNTGNAHGRLQGFVNGRDADGKRIELAPADSPILPGETRQLALLPVIEEGAAPITIRYPLQVQGQLESGSERLPLDLRFAP